LSLTIIDRLSSRWRAPGGYREVLFMAVPLILSTGAWSVLHFVDRMFLTWYSPEAIAAAMPAGILNFTIMSLFIGTAGYVNTFVAQYHGSKRFERIGPSLWQGIYISLFGGLFLLFLSPFSATIFRFIGHAPAVREQEIIYFRILCLGAAPPIMASALAGFFSGRGESWPIMWVNTLATLLNIVLDYAFIFGRWGSPEMGIKGAALATVLSGCFSVLFYLLLLFRRSYNRIYRTMSGWAFEAELFTRMLRFGLPNGVQFMLDMAGFTAFILLVGRLGTAELAASNIAFNINTLAFMPMIGFGIAISVLVGRNLGENNPAAAEYSVWSVFQLTLFYMGLISLSYVLFPEIYIAAFAARADPESFRPIRDIALVLLRFVAVYSVFDAMNIIFASAVKGAGDTRFVMLMIVSLALGGLVVPSYMAIIIFKMNIYSAWIIVTVYIILLGACFLWRFLGGKWKSMRVIEEAPHSLPPNYPAAPGTEFEA
jgi:MATE family multidrug resistance protein